MKRNLLGCAFALACWSTPLLAADPVRIEDTSFRDADGHRVQQLRVIVDAPVKAVWDAFTTDAGFERWAVPVAHITPGNDGMMESSTCFPRRSAIPTTSRTGSSLICPTSFSSSATSMCRKARRSIPR